MHYLDGPKVISGVLIKEEGWGGGKSERKSYDKRSRSGTKGGV